MLLGYKPSVGKTTAGSPVQFEGTRTVGDLGSIQTQGLGSGGGVLELDKAVAGISMTRLATASQVWVGE